MPQVIRGIRSNSDNATPTTTSPPPVTTTSNPNLTSTTSPIPTSPNSERRVNFLNSSSRDNSSNSIQQTSSHPPSRSRSRRRRSSVRDRPESNVYYDSRAATRDEFKRRASTLQSYYLEHPDLLPQLPFTFRHGFKRWRLGGYIALMVFDACIVPIGLYYAMTFGGNVKGFIVFAVVTAIWGGPTYVEFAVRSLRLIKKQRFYKPLGVDKRWAFDITNWILVLSIFVVTVILIVGAAPHDVFLRVLSMPGPAILFCIAGPIFLLSLYSACGWKAPFRISSTPKGEHVLPGIFYIVEDIVAVNSGGGRPFREGMAARYKASPLFRKMMRDLSWFWSIGGLLMGAAVTVVVVLNAVPEPISYGIGWGVPFLWAGIWAAITIPWVRRVMHRERTQWEEETNMMTSTMHKAPALPIIPQSVDEERETAKSSESGSGDTDQTVVDAAGRETGREPETVHETVVEMEGEKIGSAERVSTSGEHVGDRREQEVRDGRIV